MSSAKLIKSLVKKNVGPKSTFGTNPSDPWSAKANIAESASLDQYLLSRGINPKFVSKDTKVAHSKSNLFLKWQADHARRLGEESEEVVTEGKEDKIAQLKKDHATAVHWSKNDTNPHKREAARQKAEKIKAHLEKQYNQGVAEDFKDPKNKEEVFSEATDRMDVIAMDIPFLIRMLEYAREDAKTDMALHKVVEKLINIRKRGVMTMKQYKYVTSIRECIELTEEYDCDSTPKNEKEWRAYAQKRAEAWRIKLLKVDEGKEADYGYDYQKSVQTVKALAVKKPVDMKSLAARMQASYRRDNEKNKQGVAESNGYDDNRTGFAKKPREDDEGHTTTKFKAKSIMDRPHTVHIDGNPWKKFSTGHQAHAAVNTLTSKGKKATAIAHFKENTLDSMAATQAPNDCANSPDTTIPAGKKLIRMSRSAQIIKSAYKKGMKEEVVREELYDHEKEDKSVSGLKKPKVSQPTEKAAFGETPKAAIVMSGGKTMTGGPRDTIEIDPAMKGKPGGPNDPTVKKQNNK